MGSELNITSCDEDQKFSCKGAFIGGKCDKCSIGNDGFPNCHCSGILIFFTFDWMDNFWITISMTYKLITYFSYVMTYDDIVNRSLEQNGWLIKNQPFCTDEFIRFYENVRS